MGFLDSVESVAGQVINVHAHIAGGVLDAIGLDEAGHEVDKWGDGIADDLGSDVGELNLGESDDPKELVHGDVHAIGDTVAHLRKFATAFEETGAGLSRMDSDHWQGKAADAFRQKFSTQPTEWRVTADACEAAAKALEALESTISWAQGQAQQAIDTYNMARRVSKAAQDVHNRQIDDFNHAVNAYNQASAAGQNPTPPTKPAEFHDPGAEGLKHAAEMLLAARKQRVDAAHTAEQAIKAATSNAPKEPGLMDRLGMDLMDAPGQAVVGLVHFEAGLVKGGADLLKFGRGLNPLDVYNITHPAMFLDHLVSVGTGLIHTENHPTELLSAVAGSGWGSDPAEAGGKAVFNLISGVATGGGSEAGAVAERLAVDAAENAAERDAIQAGENAAEKAATNAAEHPVVPPVKPGELPDGWLKKPTETNPASALHDPAPPHVGHPADTAPNSTVGQDLVGHDPVGHDPVGHDPVGHDPVGHDPVGHDLVGHDPVGHDPVGHDPVGHDPAGHDPVGHDPVGHDPVGHDPAGHDPAGHDPVGHDPAKPGWQIDTNPQAEFERMQDLEKMNAAQADISKGARAFKDDYDVMDFGRSWNDDVSRLPEAQKDAIKAYTHGSDQDINGALRGNGPPTGDIANRISELDRAVAARPVPEDVVVSRGTDIDYLNMTPRQMEGKTFTEEGFMSTSPGDEPPASFRGKQAILHLRVPAGTPGVWVEGAGEMAASERELLLGRGLQWRADQVIKTADGKIHVYGVVL